VLALGGGGMACRAIGGNPLNLVKPDTAATWYRWTPLPAGTEPPERYTEDQYDDRFEYIAFGLRDPPCEWIRHWVGTDHRPIFLLVHGIGGDGWEWYRTLPLIESMNPAAIFMFRWSPVEKTDQLAEFLAVGASRIARCAGDDGGPLVILAHSAGGILASFAANRIILPEPAAQRRAYVVTVASPLAGNGSREPTLPNELEPNFLWDMGVGFLHYPPAAAGVKVAHLRTRYPSDPVMKPNFGGFRPNRKGAGVPGALEVDLPKEWGHILSLRRVAEIMAKGFWRPWEGFGRIVNLFETVEPDNTPRETPGVCKLRADIVDAGDPFIVADFDRPPAEDRVHFWEGATLPEHPPIDPARYVHCRPCDCQNGTVSPWDDWEVINRRAYERLRESKAPYPVAIVPGFVSNAVSRHRMEEALQLLDEGWVAALVVSGGYRDSGQNLARRMYDLAWEIGQDEQINVLDRIFVEPCSEDPLTNLRNSLRLMQGLGLRYGLLLTDAKMTFQAQVYQDELDERVPLELQCPMGRVSYLWGDGIDNRAEDGATGCRPFLSWRSNVVGFFIASRRPAIFWVSPIVTEDGGGSALDCGAGAPRIRELEPDDIDPWTGKCLPMVGEQTLECD